MGGGRLTGLKSDRGLQRSMLLRLPKLASVTTLL